jgi:hypothetical protein
MLAPPVLCKFVVGVAGRFGPDIELFSQFTDDILAQVSNDVEV